MREKLLEYDCVPLDVSFSCSFPFPEEAGREAAELLRAAGNEAEWSDGRMRVTRESGGDLDAVAEILSKVMERRGVPGTVSLQASFSAGESYDCRRGGIAAAIAAGDFRFTDTGQAARDLERDIRMARVASEMNKSHPGELERMAARVDAILAERGASGSIDPCGAPLPEGASRELEDMSRCPDELGGEPNHA